MKYYAVRKGRNLGIFSTWSECEANVKGFPSAEYKSFTTKQEADDYINNTTTSASTTRDSGLFKPYHPSKKYQIWTDGSCERNVAGYGYILLDNNENVAQDYGRVDGKQTNQRAELTAIAKGIARAIELGWNDIEVVSDSDYSIQSLTVWSKNWIMNNWKTSTGNPVENQDIIKPILELLHRINVKFIHVYSHRGVYWNEQADSLADLGRMK